MTARKKPQAATIPFFIRLDPELRNQLRQLAFRVSFSANARCSESLLIHEALKAYLEDAAVTLMPELPSGESGGKAAVRAICDAIKGRRK